MLKKSFSLSGHKTSIKLEESFWIALEDVAIARKMTLRELISHEDVNRKNTNFASHLRVLVLHYYKNLAISSLNQENICEKEESEGNM